MNNQNIDRDMKCERDMNCNNDNSRPCRQNRMYYRNNMNNNMKYGMPRNIPSCPNAVNDANKQKKADRSCYMKSIYELGFELTEAILYLDTHPDDKEAIAFYMDVKEAFNEVVEAYSKEYGPINYFTERNSNYWTWVKTPMPWEMEGC